MTIKELAELMVQMGHDIKLQKRSDGGYLITKIDGVSYKGASGNIQARSVAGVQISQARAYQLSRIRPPKKIAPKQRKQTKLPEDLVKKMRKIQREWRKTHSDIKGSISMRGLRYQYEKYGREQAELELDKSYRYAQGLAYIENVQWMIDRWESLKPKAPESDQSYIQKIIDILVKNQFKIKEEWIHPLYYNAYYPYIQNAIDIQTALYIVQNTII